VCPLLGGRKQDHVLRTWSFTLHPGLTDEITWAFWDAFIADAIEVNGLMFGGSESGYVCSVGRTSAREEHRQAIEAWRRARPEVQSAQAGPLEDAWHEPVASAP
jgi:uncharacterized protein YggL (DUF469 family)